MAALLRRSGPKKKLWLAFGLLLLSQLSGSFHLHQHHGEEPSFLPHAGELVYREACHPQEAPHFEAAGSGYLDHLCALCLHHLRSAGARRPAAPRLAPPASVLATAVISSCPRGGEIPRPWSSRAPPAA